MPDNTHKKIAVQLLVIAVYIIFVNCRVIAGNCRSKNIPVNLFREEIQLCESLTLAIASIGTLIRRMAVLPGAY